METAYFLRKYKSLPRDVIFNLINYYSDPDDRNACRITNSEKALLAIAYANLISDEPEHVTESHIRLLKKEFTSNQIEELKNLISEITATA